VSLCESVSCAEVCSVVSVYLISSLCLCRAYRYEIDTDNNNNYHVLTVIRSIDGV